MAVDEYQAYLASDEYEYHGGFYDMSPVIVEVPTTTTGTSSSTATPGVSASRSASSSTDRLGSLTIRAQAAAGRHHMAVTSEDEPAFARRLTTPDGAY